MSDWILALLIATTVYLIYVIRAYRNHFKRWGIPQPSEVPFIGINFSAITRRKHFNDVVSELYNEFKDAKYVGCHSFLSPIIVLRDLELIKTVLVKNFDHFAYHKQFVAEDVDPLFSKSLFSLNGERWREVRNVLSPAFTSSKMRTMYVLMSRCTENFVNEFLELYRNEEAVDLKDAFSRFATDVIATCAFGIEVDSLKNRNNEFYVRGTRVTQFSGFIMMVKFFLIETFPSLANKLRLRLMSNEDAKFFIDTVKATAKTREEKGITRPDMLQLMMEAREKSDLSILEMTAQAFIFFVAGFETTSSQNCMIAYELAVNPDVQTKLQDEIDDVMRETNGQPTYEAVNGMTYLDAIFSEALRKHSGPTLNRMCSKEFELPPAVLGAKPYIIKPGVEIMVPMVGIHRDPQFYEDPGRFDPDRFVNKRAAAGEVTSLGFGLGPRMCIGNRFAILEAKVLFVHLLAKCSLVPCKKTCIPLKYDIDNFNPSPKGGSWLKIEMRKISS